jgi:hypothetical protein
MSSKQEQFVDNISDKETTKLEATKLEATKLEATKLKIQALDRANKDAIAQIQKFKVDAESAKMYASSIESRYSAESTDILNFNLKENNEKLQITEYIAPTSASKSVICKGFFFFKVAPDNIKPVFCKFFKYDNYKLVYEAKTYRRINIFRNNPENKDLNETIEQHILQSECIIFINRHNIIEIANEASKKSINDRITEISGGIKDDFLLYGIITPDYNTISLYRKLMTEFTEYYKKEDINIGNNIINIIFSALYSIYLLHTKLDIMHNDNHFNNILYSNKPLYKKIYIIENIKIETYETFATHIFDFDNSSKVKEHTKEEEKKNYELDNYYQKDHISTSYCARNGSCNRHTQKDVYVFIVELYKIYMHIQSIYKDKKSFDFIKSIIQKLIDYTSIEGQKLYEAIRDNLRNKKLFATAYLATNEYAEFIPYTGDIAHYEHLEIKDVLMLFIIRFKENLFITNQDKTKHTFKNIGIIRDIFKHYETSQSTPSTVSAAAVEKEYPAVTPRPESRHIVTYSFPATVSAVAFPAAVEKAAAADTVAGKEYKYLKYKHKYINLKKKLLKN